MRVLLLLSFLICAVHIDAQSTATDVTVTDCSGTTHNLFSELDAGKIIVVGWTMPCATCVSPLLDVHNAVLDFAISNPGVVEYWVNDDFGNSTCSNIEGWCTTNGITNAAYFSASELSMFDYGTAGMPKVVVLGCTNHKVYYNKNDNPYGPHVTSSIQTALAEIDAGCESAGQYQLSPVPTVDCFPVPASTVLNITTSGEFDAVPHFEITSPDGMTHSIDTDAITTVSDQQVAIGIEQLSEGMYFLKIEINGHFVVKKFQVIH